MKLKSLLSSGQLVFVWCVCSCVPCGLTCYLLVQSQSNFHILKYCSQRIVPNALRIMHSAGSTLAACLPACAELAYSILAFGSRSQQQQARERTRRTTAAAATQAVGDAAASRSATRAERLAVKFLLCAVRRTASSVGLCFHIDITNTCIDFFDSLSARRRRRLSRSSSSPFKCTRNRFCSLRCKLILVKF